MPSLKAVVDLYQRRQRTRAQRAATQIAELWRSIDRGNIAGSWTALLPSVVTVLTTAQATAAASGGVFIDDALEAQGITADAEGRIVTTSFAGVASDGRRLESLLAQPPLRTLGYLSRGLTLDRAMAGGLASLDMMVRTQIADAGRAAESAAITARPTVTGYVRMLSLPSCSRCIILAGRTYKWNSGFRRHPRCDCRHIPSQENSAGDLTTDPKKAFESMSESEQVRVFGRAGAEALRSGADLNQVVNARRGMQTATVYGRKVLLTTEGTTTRGFAGRRLGARNNSQKRNATDRYTSARRVRLMPEEILREADGDRVEAIRLLRFHGYIR